MARNLAELRSRYNSAAKAPARGAMGGPGGGRNNAGRQQGKPKDAARTIARLLKYVHGHRLRFLIVLVCMLFSTVTSLVAGYITAPIIDNLTLAINPSANIQMTEIEKVTDRFIRGVLDLVFGGGTGSGAPADIIMRYISAAVVILGIVYLV